MARFCWSLGVVLTVSAGRPQPSQPRRGCVVFMPVESCALYPLALGAAAAAAQQPRGWGRPHPCPRQAGGRACRTGGRRAPGRASGRGASWGVHGSVQQCVAECDADGDWQVWGADVRARSAIRLMLMMRDCESHESERLGARQWAGGLLGWMVCAGGGRGGHQVPAWSSWGQRPTGCVRCACASCLFARGFPVPTSARHHRCSLTLHAGCSLRRCCWLQRPSPCSPLCTTF